MNHGPLVFLGALATFAASWTGLVLVPQFQMGGDLPAVQKAPSPDYPAARPGQAAQGLQVYRALGCAECHSQQVRPVAADLERGWGRRRTVARDFLQDSPVLIGRLRAGPDLANLGLREPGQYAAPWKYQSASNHLDELRQWHFVHLLNPRLLAPGSLMPAYPFLFEEKPLSPGAAPDPNAVKLPEKAAGLAAGRQYIPRLEARALVAYLLSLRADAPLFEAPLPEPAPPTNAVAPANAPAAQVSANQP